MRELKGRWGRWRTENLRHRFSRRGWGGAALLAAVPWITVALLAGLTTLVGDRILVRPGVVFDLPRAPFREGLRYGLTAVMLPVARSNGMETLVFFDDERFVLAAPPQLEQLVERVRGRVALEPRREILLLADRRVPLGDVMTVVNLARDAGVNRVNVATKPE
jgi:biopolymer transport protein ExbD